MEERRSPCGKARENTVLINLQRNAKSLSPSGNVHMACRWSGKITMASMAKGCRPRVYSKALRSNAMFSVNRDCERSARFNVKK